MNIKTRTVISAILGNVAEWYDYALYGYFATTIGRLFFSSSNKNEALMLAFVVFFTGFIARPFGAFLFGHVGDKYGRKRALLISISVMGLCTSAIGLLPIYSTIGVVAPILLISFRVIQGLSVSGELSGASSMLVETAKPNQRGFMTSLVMSSVYMGQLLGSLIGYVVSFYLSKAQFVHWGWRLPFLPALLFALLIFILRFKSNESPEFEKAKSHEGWPFKKLVRMYKFACVRVVGLICLPAVAGVLLVGFLPSYLLSRHIFNYHQMLLLTSCAMLFIMLLLPVVGSLSDRIGPKRVFLFGTIGLFIFAYPIFFLIAQQSLVLVLTGVMLFSLFIATVNGVTTITIASCFPVNVRQSGIGVSFNISLILFGGTAPMMAEWLSHLSSPHFYIALYIMISALVTLPFVLTLNSKSLKSEYFVGLFDDEQVEAI